MRIAYVCADRGVPVFGWQKGCSIHVQEVVRAFQKLGHEVDIYATNLSGEIPHDLHDITVHQLPNPADGLKRASREQAQLKGNQSLHAKLKTGGPYDLVYERYSLWSFAAMDYAAGQDIPGMLEVNSPLIDEQNKFRGLVDVDAAKRCAQRSFSMASAICAVSGKVRDYLTDGFNVGEKLAVIPNGVDPDRFEEALRRRSHGSRFTVGFVGSLKPWHGIDSVIDAFAVVHRHTPDSQLLIVGDGPERDNIEAQIRDFEIGDAVTLTGAIKPANIPEALAAMDVGVAPYPKMSNHYFSPMKVFEYMAAGLPVVASSAGQLTDIITDECDGLLCEPGNTKALFDALMCLQRDPALRRRLGRTARRHILTNHTWQIVASRILAFADTRSADVSGALANVAT